MSLINKMLQDLDARGGAAKPAASADVRPVAAERTSRTAIAVGAGIGVLIVAAGAGGWYALNRAPAAPVAVVAPAPAAVAAPAPAAAPAPVAATPAPPAAAPVESADAAPTSPMPGDPPAARELAAAAPAEAVGRMTEEPAAPRTARARPPRAERSAMPAPATLAPTVPAAHAADAAAGQGAALTSRQQGENAYRRALAALQEGRVAEGIAALEAAVLAYPRHEAARQTLVGLLLENGRADEAMRHAQLGLGLDAAQPQLAMVLARLQLERGGAADETLLRTLPHARGNADYIAFLAGVLQKQGRHREAAEQYEAALRLRPANGVWWMGLGMSLQAQNLRTSAAEAYRKARETGLSPALQEFVERRLGQLE